MVLYIISFCACILCVLEAWWSTGFHKSFKTWIFNAKISSPQPHLLIWVDQFHTWPSCVLHEDLKPGAYQSWGNNNMQGKNHWVDSDELTLLSPCSLQSKWSVAMIKKRHHYSVLNDFSCIRLYEIMFNLVSFVVLLNESFNQSAKVAALTPLKIFWFMHS